MSYRARVLRQLILIGKRSKKTEDELVKELHRITRKPRNSRYLAEWTPDVSVYEKTVTVAGSRYTIMWSVEGAKVFIEDVRKD